MDHIARTNFALVECFWHRVGIKSTHCGRLRDLRESLSSERQKQAQREEADDERHYGKSQIHRSFRVKGFRV